MNHAGNVELDHGFIEGIPVRVGERRGRPVSARRVGIEIAADESELGDGAAKLQSRVGDERAR